MKKYLGVTLVAAVALSLSIVSTSHAAFIESVADIFQADFTAASGTLPVTNVGLATPNGGAITFYANGDAQGTSSLVAGPATPGGPGTGWDDLSTAISYNRGGAWGIGPGAGDAIVGHGGDGATLNPAEHKIDYTVPVSGNYDLTGNIQQPFEAARSMRFQLFNNDFTGAGVPIIDIETGGETGPAPGVSATEVGVSLTAGDILTVIVDGSGSLGTQVGTWVGFNLTVENVIPEPASLALMGLGSILVMSCRRR